VTAETVMVIVAAALLCAALAVAVAVLASIASLVGLLPARTPQAGERERAASRNAAAPAGDGPGQRA